MYYPETLGFDDFFHCKIHAFPKAPTGEFYVIMGYMAHMAIYSFWGNLESKLYAKKESILKPRILLAKGSPKRSESNAHFPLKSFLAFHLIKLSFSPAGS
jgi:hypothetical protein